MSAPLSFSLFILSLSFSFSPFHSLFLIKHFNLLWHVVKTYFQHIVKKLFVKVWIMHDISFFQCYRIVYCISEEIINVQIASYDM